MQPKPLHRIVEPIYQEFTGNSTAYVYIKSRKLQSDLMLRRLEFPMYLRRYSVARAAKRKLMV